MDGDCAPWGFSRDGAGAMAIDGVSTLALAAAYETPLYVVSEASLRARARRFKRAFAGYPGEVLTCFSYKTNPTPAVLRVLHDEDIAAEVVNGYELWLATAHMGVPPSRVVVGGPNKSAAEVAAIARTPPGLVVAEGLDDLQRVGAAAIEAGTSLDVALRLRPGLVPKGMNPSTATGGKKSHFGMIVDSEEYQACLSFLDDTTTLRLRGVHAHIGSGIHDLRAFERSCARLFAAYRPLVDRFGADTIDLGGGLGVGTSREFTSMEMLRYLATGKLPTLQPSDDAGLTRSYGEAVGQTLVRLAEKARLPPPRLIVEPGRALTSPAQVLLLSVGAVRHREGAGRCVFVDGGAMSTSPMFLSELHAVAVAGPVRGAFSPAHVFGRVPSPLDAVYRNLKLPDVGPGDVLAVFDVGAYFGSTSSNFGGPRPAVVMIDERGDHRLVQRRETFEDLVRRDLAP